MKFTPVYDKGYYPMIVKLNEFKKAVANEESKTLKICVERNDGYNYIFSIYLRLINYFMVDEYGL